jgi:hypothetical protein
VIEMALQIGIEKRGLRDVTLMAKTPEEIRVLINLFQEIEPEIRSFEKLIKHKLNREPMGQEGGIGK